MPNEVSFAISISRKGEKEWRTIEAVLFAKLCELLRSRLLTKNCDGWIAGNEFDQECYERDDRPNNQHENQQSSYDAEDPIPNRGAHARA